MTGPHTAALDQWAASAKSDTVRLLLTDIGQRFTAAMNDDFNTAAAIATLFELARHASAWVRDAAPREDLVSANAIMQRLAGDVLGLKWQEESASQTSRENDLIQILADLRQEARKARNFELGDQVRQRLAAIGVQLRDTPEGTKW